MSSSPGIESGPRHWWEASHPCSPKFYFIYLKINLFSTRINCPVFLMFEHLIALAVYHKARSFVSVVVYSVENTMVPFGQPCKIAEEHGSRFLA